MAAVRSLVPAGGHALVLVTSRDPLTVGLARVWLQSGEPGRAIAHGREALATSRAAGVIEGRGRTLARLGDAWAAAGGHGEARGYRFEALRCFESTDEVLPADKLARLRELAHACPVGQAG